MGKRLLIVEDDLALRTGLRDTFAGEGFDVTAAADGDVARDLWAQAAFDVVLLDLMLPGRFGLELLRERRAAGDRTPVLVLTARGDEGDKVLGLELGADDYVTKPFSLRELLARVRALLRRSEAGRAGDAGGAGAPFRIGAAVVDLAAFEVRHGGRVHALSPKEAAMLALLWRERGKVVTRNRFLDEVWGSDRFVSNRTIDTHVLNLRQKVEPDPRRPRHVLTVHGVGYRLAVEEGAPGGAA